MEITIRAVEPDDAEDMLKVVRSERAYTGTLQLPFQSLEQMRQRLGTPRENSWHLCAEVEGEVVGSIGLTMSTRPRRRHVGDIGMMVRDDMQGKGVGTALMQAILDLTDNWLDLSRIELTVYTDNPAALALYKKFGFEIEGTHRKYAFRNGVYVDAYSMARVKA